MSGGSDIVRWSRPPLAVELRSSDASVLGRAAVIFRPWRGEGDVVRTFRYTVEPVGLGPGDGARLWEVLSDSGADPLVLDSVDRAVAAVEFASVAALVETPAAALCVHCALVAKGGRGVLLVGRAEAGKSTLACALWRAGWSLLGDDTVVIETSCARAIAIPRRVSLRYTSYDLVGSELMARIQASPSCARSEKGLLFHPDEVDGADRLDAVRLSSVFFLDRRGGTAGPAEVLAIDPALAVVALLPHTNARSGDLGEALRRIAPVADEVSFFDIGRGPLDAMVTAVEQTLVRVSQPT